MTDSILEPHNCCAHTFTNSTFMHIKSAHIHKHLHIVMHTHTHSFCLYKCLSRFSCAKHTCKQASHMQNDTLPTHMPTHMTLSPPRLLHQSDEICLSKVILLLVFFPHKTDFNPRVHLPQRSTDHRSVSISQLSAREHEFILPITKSSSH